MTHDDVVRQYWPSSKQRARERDSPPVDQWRTWRNPSLETREQQLGWLEIDFLVALARACGWPLTEVAAGRRSARTRWLTREVEAVLAAPDPLDAANRLLDAVEAGEA